MLTIHLTDPERILLLDALEAFVEASLSQHDPDAETAQQLIKRLQDVENITNDPACMGRSKFRPRGGGKTGHCGGHWPRTCATKIPYKTGV